MNDIRSIINLLVETMTHYEYTEIEFRGEEMEVTVKLYGDEIEDWWFTKLDSKQHKALNITKDERYEIDEKIEEMLEPAW